MPFSDNKTGARITRNALMLYVRMSITIFIGLYTSRVVLEQLGINDFGLYGVVGSIIALTEFVNSALSNSFSRFYAYQSGKGDESSKHHVYGTALTISIIAAFIIILLGETLGLWYFSNHLEIPANRINAAKFTYHCCVAGAALRVLQLPFSSCLIAHEKMVAFAYIEILNSVLRLGAAILLTISTFDKLYTCSAFTLATTVIILICFISYCRARLNECKGFAYSRKALSLMSRFSILDLYGTICYSTRTHGTALILNHFFGVALNATNAIAMSIQHLLNGITGNIITAFSPQIIKQYSAGAVDHMLELTFKSTRYTFYLFLIIAIPLTIETKQLLHLWLGDNIPEYSTTFCQLIIISTGLAIPVNIFNTCIHATGRIKFLSIGIGSTYLLTLPIIYIAFINGLNPGYAYIIYIVIMCVITILTTLNIKRLIKQFDWVSYIKNVALPVLAVSAVSISTPLLIRSMMDDSITRTATTLAVSIITTIGSIALLGLNHTERAHLISKIKKDDRNRH